MAKQWKCARCSTKNDEGTLTCSNCRMIRGAVVVPGTFTAYPDPPGPDAVPPAGPSPGWASSFDTPASTDASQAAELGAAGDPGQPGPTDEPLATGQPVPSYWSSAGAAYPAAETAAPKPIWQRIPIGLVIFVLLVGAGAIGGLISNASRSDTGEIVNDGDMMATDLRVGDCFDVKDPTAEEISDVTARPCTDPHEYELFWTGSMTEGAYPTEAAFRAFMQGNCFDAFGTFVGKPYEDSVLDIYWLYPLEDGWGEGDRSIQCAAYHPTKNRLTTSLKASAQ
jgi:hypothetical protein